MDTRTGRQKHASWVVSAFLGLATIMFALTHSHVRADDLPDTNPAGAPVLTISETGDPRLDGMLKGVRFLHAHHQPTGHFLAPGGRSPGTPFTALIVDALVHLPAPLLESQDETFRTAVQGMIDMGGQALLASQQENGAIFEVTYSVYTTGVSVVALQSWNRPDLTADPIARAQAFLLSAQNRSDGINRGGAGYDPDSRPDLSNTVVMLEALEASGLPKEDPAYQLALEFVMNNMNDSEFNTSGVVTTEDGGFTYRPGESPAGEVELRDGRKAARSYGTMSYAGLISFLYADVGVEDPRVRSAFRWVENHYDLTENPGMMDAGVYYYYRIMAKALERYGATEIRTADGTVHHWAADLAQTLLGLQHPEGSWRNENTQYLEGNAILCTAYALRTLQICREVMERAD